jgi:mono/diheme cytochrome c family protein
MSKIIYFLVAAGILFVGFFLWATRHAELPLTDLPKATDFPKKLISRGQDLVRLGNCKDCHSRIEGKQFAGGRSMLTPFGKIYSSNITPEPKTGIGGWSLPAFERAMEKGINRNGQHLYPAFPYDRFTKINKKDIAAIYAYLMTNVKPVNYKPPQTNLGFPWNIRAGLSFWKLLFLENTKWKPDPSRDKEWNAGAYLVEGIAHCGSCHSPRNLFGAEIKGPRAYSGGYSGNWFAPQLNSNLSGMTKFSESSLVNYLLDGWDKNLGIAAGPMTKVVNNLYDGNEDNAFAIATYIMSLGTEASKDQALDFQKRLKALRDKEWGHPNSPPLPASGKLREGAQIYEKQCSKCHKSGRKLSLVGFASLLSHTQPNNMINIILEGIKPPLGSLEREMPSRNNEINNSQLEALLMFLRNRFSDEKPWADLDLKIAKIRPQKNKR